MPVYSDKSNPDVHIYKLVTNKTPLDAAAEKFDFAGKSVIIADFKSPLLGDLKSEIKKLKGTTEIFNVMKDNPESLKKLAYDMIIIALPSHKTESGFDDQTKYEKLFKFLQKLEYSQQTKIAGLSTEQFFGLESDAYPLSGAVAGFIKTLAFEFNLNSKQIYTSDIKSVMNELKLWDNSREVGFKNNERYSIGIAVGDSLTEVTPPLNISGSDLMLVTGGARGITFECVKRLCTVSKPRVALMGRTKIALPASELRPHSEAEIKDWKKNKGDELRLKGEKVTPIRLDKEWEKVANQIEMHMNVEYLKAMGIDARYYACDISNKDDSGKVIKQIQNDYGTDISIVVHGAGLEESKLFKTKNFDTSRAIVSVKVEGVWNILKNINTKSLKRVVCFSSIAGRFGNNGQVDYSYANGYLARLCWMLSQKGISSIAMDWTAWAEVGMATKGSIMDILVSLGVTPLPLNDGTRIFTGLITRDARNEVVVAGKLGFMLGNDSGKAKSGPSISKKDFPMISSAEESGNVVKASRTLTHEGDLYMKDHQIMGNPVLPGVMGLETFAETYNHATGKKASEMLDVSFAAPVKMFAGQNKDIFCEYNKADAGITLKSLFVSKAAKGEDKITDHFNAVIGKGAEGSEKIDVKKYAAGSVPLLTKSEIYEIYFHGPSFQVLDGLIEVSGRRSVVKYREPGLPLFDTAGYKLQIDPLYIESALQGAGMYDMIVNGLFSLPSKIKRLLHFGNGKAEYVVSDFLFKDETHSYFNVYVVDAAGSVIVKLEELGIIHTRFPINIREDLAKKMKGIGEMGKISGTSAGPLKIVSTGSVEALSSSEGFVESRLTPAEIGSVDKMKNSRRRIERLSGIIALKELYAEMTGNSSYHSIEIRKEEEGRPYLYDIERGEALPLYASITHSNGFAAAAISSTPVGIDLESVSDRSESFYKMSFSDAEMDMIKSDSAKGTELWTVKEAFLKMIGKGFHSGLRDMEVRRGKTPGGYIVKLIKDAGLGLGMDEFAAVSVTSGNYSFSLCGIKA